MEIKVTFLGSGSSVPTAKRNHPSVLLQYKGEYILIDCGEGTQRQFRKAKINPCKLTRILITHWHSDHVLGLPGLLKTLSMNGYNKKLFVYGPRGTKKLMDNLLRLFVVHEDYPIEVGEVSGTFFKNDDFELRAASMSHGVAANAYSFIEKDKKKIRKDLLKKEKISSSPLLKKLLDGKDVKIGEKKLKSKEFVYVTKGKKITFVLDTAFNQKAISIARKSSLLICESSFMESEKDQAKKHKHLTTQQAAKIASKSNSEKLILMHMSQRYENSEAEFLLEAQKIFKNTVLAKDLMSVEI